MEAADLPIEIFNTSGLEIPVTGSEAAFLLNTISSDQECAFSFVEVVFVDEEEIVRVNKEFLGRDYITDIISFRYDDNATNLEIEGTLYCCAQRIEEQSHEFSDTIMEEFIRIITHGLLHLIGFDDQTPEEKEKMTALENRYLKAFTDQ